MAGAARTKLARADLNPFFAFGAYCSDRVGHEMVASEMVGREMVGRQGLEP
jgi:hypothetical protein